MVSLVIVSHSANLANGIYELAGQMSQGKAKIALAAGIDDPENPIGTDAIAVMNAIESVYDESGVLLMVDMGSAILSAEMAIDLMEPEKAEKVHICAAPILEGTILAAVAASAGLDIDSVEKEAHRSLIPKYKALEQTHYLNADEADDQKPQEQDEAEVIDFIWTVKNKHGLHARPSAAIVNLLTQFDADAEIIHGSEKANAKSLNSVSVLGVRMNDTITLRAKGSDAKVLIDEFSNLAYSNFGESTEEQENKNEEFNRFSSSENNDDSLLGVSVCKGIAIGKLAIFKQTMPVLPERVHLGISEEKSIFDTSLEKVICNLRGLIESPDAGEEQRNIFEAHIMMLTDEDFLNDILSNINKGENAEIAVHLAVSELALAFKEADSEYMRAREADVWDIGRQLICQLCGVEDDHKLEFNEPVILLGDELSPSNTAKISSKSVKAICLSEGDPCSHSAVIAKTKGIPTVFKLNGCLESFEQGRTVCVDAFEGRLWYNPTPDHFDKLSNHYSHNF